LPEGTQFRAESILLASSVEDADVFGFLVVIFVDVHLTGFDSRVGVIGTVVGIDVSWGGKRALLPIRVPLQHEGASSPVSISLAVTSVIMR